MLRFITCGSVDDGKSTLIGRLLFDAKQVFEDHLVVLEADSKRVGTQGSDVDFALLVDGLAAERQQGITIDVAYRYFATDKRKFVVADTPGHEQYTRNMVTGASTADVAVILIDARKGVLTQTRRHSFVVALLGIKQVALAVNKLDLVGFSEETFAEIATDYGEFAKRIGIAEVVAVPICALAGDNITVPSTRTPWYRGPTLLSYLEAVDVANRSRSGPFRMPVQWVNRPNSDLRGYSGLIARGELSVGDKIRVLTSGQESTVADIVTYDGSLSEAVEGQSVTVTLADDIDVSRGDLLAAAAAPPQVADQFEADIIWMSDQEMLPGRRYLMKIGTRSVGMTMSRPKYQVNVNTLDHVAAKTLGLNAIGVCNIHLDAPVAFDSYSDCRSTGGFIVIDRYTNATVAAGLLRFALRRSDNIHWQAVEVDRNARAALKGQRPALVWFTGLSGAGKSTIANLVEKILYQQGRHTYLLDGDNVRHGLNSDLGFTDADRVENIRRVAEVAKLFVDAGIIVLASFISPFEAERRFARDLLGEGNFIEVFVDAPIAVAESRDPKGLYAKARRGELVNFTGIDSPYEAPESPEVRVDTGSASSPQDSAAQVVAHLRLAGIIT
jgi:bifunctional enzyme CysN/CysC